MNKIELPYSVPELRMFVVDGQFVRENYDLEFIGGGHGKLYKFIPEKEIWIDSDVNKDELEYVLLHEIYERWLMGFGLDYDCCHNLANKIEHRARKIANPNITNKLISTFTNKSV
jgi:hypothetical protein